MQGLIQLGIMLILLGFLIVFLGVLYEAFFKNRENENNEQQNRTEAGGIILIGPIPIIFGSSKKIEKWMLIIALVIVIIMAALYVLNFISGP
ncbi:TIGR00304 family protein [Acidianus sulfidivorans JP7]|uniref:TIGR00304 family protein n=1 Tax=Acidianus sulfidivorans JP7 TaxID=619593 RepID=A0A2U9ILX5_9CREN|nr:TIGR00304 family protein [Acidianus sulfidivorans]AWR97017.1 TIGR00304 family protein [Acidianus sulfidivorans JP7]